jgi:hypothetical protein
VCGPIYGGTVYSLASSRGLSFGDAFGLWTQTLAVLVAIAGGVLATRNNLRHRKRVTRG